MKKFTVLALVAALLAFAMPAMSASLDFVEGQKIPSTLKNDYTLQGQLFVDVMTAQTIGSGGTVTADACGGIKLLTAAGGVTTDTTNTFTAPSAALAGCCMQLINTGTQTITLDENTLFVSAGNVALAAGDTARVCCDGTTWYQVGANDN